MDNSSLRSFSEILESQSGKFFIDNDGVVQWFEPSKDNPFIVEYTRFDDNYIHDTNKSLRTLIVPEGVKGFVSNFMSGVRVIEKFELPDGLLAIGNNSFDMEHRSMGVFSGCILPSVTIPESVKEIGIGAFSWSHIERLELPASLCSPYGRQFKDSYIDTLVLPSEWKDDFFLNQGNELGIKKYVNDIGYMNWPSTHIKILEFSEKKVLNAHNKAEYEPAHTAEHILNATMVKMFGCPRSRNAHVERKKSKCDYILEAEPSAEQVAMVEAKVNEVVAAGLDVTIEFVDREEAAAIVDLSKLPEDASQTLRIVRIGDYDACACIGAHVANTREVGTFRIISHSFADGVWRVRWKVIQ